jgi:hypothetical protein
MPSEAVRRLRAAALDAVWQGLLVDVFDRCTGGDETADVLAQELAAS